MTSTVLILRTCKADMTAHEGFRWPESGPVEAPDWDPTPECGHGLHGLLWGCGDASSITYPEGRWLVVEANAADVVDLGGKVKFPRGQVVFVGTRDEAIAYLDQHGAADKPVVYATRTAGAYGTATAGDYGTAVAGAGGTATVGYRGTAVARAYGTATAGAYGTATAGYAGTAVAGDDGTATAGDDGTATAGLRGTATAGDYGTAAAGYDGTATAGDDGEIRIRWFDGRRYRLAVGYVGEDGIKANTPYRVVNGKLTEVEA